MISARWSALLGLFAALSCGGAERPLESPPAPAPAPRAPAPSSAPPSASAAPAPLAAVPSARARIEPAKPSTDPKAHVEILFPFAEQRILIPKAAGYVVRTKVSGWPLAAEGPGVVVQLDHQRPRRVLDKSEIRLGSLVDEGQELSPGPHWLVLAAVDASSGVVRGDGVSRAPFAWVRFWVGDRDPKRPPGPTLALLSPAGTYNGENAAAAVVVDFLAAPERLGKGGARVKVAGPNLQLEHRLTTWQPLALRDLPSGDFEVEVSLLDEQGNPDEQSRVTRTVSVNRELSAGPAPKP